MLYAQQRIGEGGVGLEDITKDGINLFVGHALELLGEILNLK